MSDLISRQAAIDELHKHFNDGFECDKWWNSTHVLNAINDTPSAQQWIPVTERLPENEQDVLVTVNDGCTHVEADYFTGAHFLNYWDEVLAWMPLPEPWEGGADD